MLARTQTTGLHIEFGTACDGPQTIHTPNAAPNDDMGLGWRVVHSASGLAIPMRFLRQKDAIAAMGAIAPLADWHQEPAAILESIDPKTIKQKMAEVLAW